MSSIAGRRRAEAAWAHEERMLRMLKEYDAVRATRDARGGAVARC